MANSAFPILVTLLISLFPVAVYCLILASINRRADPLMVRGAWDFAGVLFAVSGMLLWAAPAMLVALYQRNVAQEPSRTFEQLWWQWRLIWAGYYALLFGGAVTLLWMRRPTTSIYNVQADLVPQVLATTFQRIGLDFAQNAYRQFLVAPAKSLAPTAAAREIDGLPRPELAAPEAIPPYSAAVEVELFPAMSHVTLHWYEINPRLRREIEDELRKHLADARAQDNPSSLWQLGISILLFTAITLASVLYVLSALFPRRW